MIYDIVPVPKPRMTQADKWKKRPAVMRYRAFCDQCRALGIQIPDKGAGIIFVIPMPQSWSRRKRESMIGMPHRQKPDISNLLKAIEDAVCEDDSTIWHYRHLEKLWGERGQIMISVPESEEQAA